MTTITTIVCGRDKVIFPASFVQALVDTTIRSRSFVIYRPDTSKLVMLEYKAKEHVLNNQAALIDFLENALKNCEIGRLDN